VGSADQPLTRAEIGAFFLLGLAVALPSLGLGLWSDDWGQGLFLRKVVAGAETQRPWWDIYVLVSGEPGQRFSGVLPWWSSPDLRVAFFRPLAAATHLLDYALWPDAPWAMHLHSGVWFGACCAAARALFGRLTDSNVGRLATVRFAVHYAHASPVGWIAQRNALLATAFALLSTWAALHFLQSGGRRWLVAALSLLTLGLLGSEGAVLAAAVMLVAGALRFGTRSRAVELAVGVVLVLVAWRLVYSGLGYGVRGSGTYIDPIESPALFASELPRRVAQLLAMHAFPQLGEVVGLGVAASAAIGAAIVLGVAYRCARMRDEPAVRLGGLALAAGCVLASTAEPHPRLLAASAAFWSLLVALSLSGLSEGLRRSVAAAAVLGSLSAQQLTMPRHEMREPASAAELAAVEHLLPNLAGRTVVLVDPPSYADVHRLQRALVYRGLAWPQWLIVLTTGDTKPELIGCCTIRLPARGRSDAAARFFAREPEDAYQGLWLSAASKPDLTEIEWRGARSGTLFLTWEGAGWAVWPPL
jgi:hypothetical protein